MTPHRYTTALAAALILLPGAAAAESSQQRWNQVFEQLDQDRDGALSRAEYERANSLQISSAPGRNPYLPESSQTGATPNLIQIPYLVLVPNPYMNLNPASPPGAGGQPQAASAPISSGSSTQLSSLTAFDTLDADRNGYLSAPSKPFALIPCSRPGTRWT
jgi:hypothetical protein